MWTCFIAVWVLHAHFASRHVLSWNGSCTCIFVCLHRPRDETNVNSVALWENRLLRHIETNNPDLLRNPAIWLDLCSFTKPLYLVYNIYPGQTLQQALADGALLLSSAPRHHFHGAGYFIIKKEREKIVLIAYTSSEDQRSLNIHAVWTQPSLSTWRNTGFTAIHRAHSVDAGQTEWLHRLI